MSYTILTHGERTALYTFFTEYVFATWTLERFDALQPLIKRELLCAYLVGYVQSEEMEHPQAKELLDKVGQFDGTEVFNQIRGAVYVFDAAKGRELDRLFGARYEPLLRSNRERRVAKKGGAA